MVTLLKLIDETQGYHLKARWYVVGDIDIMNDLPFLPTMNCGILLKPTLLRFWWRRWGILISVPEYFLSLHTSDCSNIFDFWIENISVQWITWLAGRWRTLPHVVISVNCRSQWTESFWTQMTAVGESLQLHPSEVHRFVVICKCMLLTFAFDDRSMKCW